MMDELCWNLFSQLRHLMDTFEQFHYTPCVQPDILHAYPSGATDMILPIDGIPWTGLDFHTPMIFQHSGIAYTRFVTEPVEHFVIHGYVDAVQHCIFTCHAFQPDGENEKDIQPHDIAGRHPDATLSPRFIHPVIAVNTVSARTCSWGHY
jgi:hypothetical protein